jgi:hypothetical protein
MKIRNHKKFTYKFFPYENSKLIRGTCYEFKYKRSLIKFLTKNFPECLNGIVFLDVDSFNGFWTIAEYFVWFEDDYIKLCKKNRKYYKHWRKETIRKDLKKYCAYYNKIETLMLYIDKYGEDKIHARNLVNLFYRSGFKDFIPDEEEQKYIDFYKEDGVDFEDWSDRCYPLRQKVIIEYFKAKNLIE